MIVDHNYLLNLNRGEGIPRHLRYRSNGNTIGSIDMVNAVNPNAKVNNENTVAYI